MSAVLFHVYGTLSSWGSECVGGALRDTATRPSKSAIIGLVAGAMGITYAEGYRLGELSRSLRMATLGLSPGRPIEDFHTVQVGSFSSQNLRPRTRIEELARSSDGGTMSMRRYLQGAYTLVVLEGDGDVVMGVAEALRHPVFAPCLGRKSCPPSLPFSPQRVDGPLEDAMRTIAIETMATPELRPVFGRQLPDTLPVFWEGDMLSLPVLFRSNRRDQALGHRRYGLREESAGTMTLVETANGAAA